MKTDLELQKEKYAIKLRTEKWKAAWKAAEFVGRWSHPEEVPLIFARFLTNPYLKFDWSTDSLDKPQVYGVLLLLHEAIQKISLENFAMEEGARLLAEAMKQLQPLVERWKSFESELRAEMNSEQIR